MGIARKRIGLALAAFALIGGAASVWLITRASTDHPAAVTAAAPPQPAASPADAVRMSKPLPGDDPSLPPSAPAAPSALDMLDTAYPVNLDELRRRLPNNLYWKLGAPTKDDKLLRMRTEQARQTNELYGKVLSTTATEEEIRRYYAERRRVSEDYIEFAALVLAEYRDRLPEEHIGLYEMSIRMHRTRLDELPRHLEDALARLRSKQRHE